MQNGDLPHLAQSSGTITAAAGRRLSAHAATKDNHIP
jgi:hypothetical protein